MHYGTDSAFCQIDDSQLTVEEIKYVIPPYGTSYSSSFCEELKQTQKCLIICVAVTTTTILCCSMFEKLDFHQLKLVGLHVVTIKCHQPAAWVSVSTEFSLLSPWALAGHTSCHPSPTVVPPTPLSVFSLHLSISQGAVTCPSLQSSLSSLSARGNQPPWCQCRLGASLLTKHQAFRRHINCHHSSVRLESLLHNQRTWTPVQLSGYEQTWQWDCRP